MSTQEKTVRWILSLPAGILAMMVLAGAIRLSNPNMPFVADLIVASLEFWAFLYVVMQVVPGQHKRVVIVYTILFLSISMFSVYAWFSPLFPAPTWNLITIDIALFVGTITSGLYHYKKCHKFSDEIKGRNSDIQLSSA